MMPISPEDDSLHDPGDSPYWTEGARFPISVPERSVGGWVMLAWRRSSRWRLPPLLPARRVPGRPHLGRGRRTRRVAAGSGRGRRFEQPGRLTGTVAVRGDILHVDCWSVRDRSWGPPPAARPGRRTDTPCVFDDDGDGFRLHVTATSEAAHDPVDGTTERLVSGWHRADRVTRPLVSGTRHVTRRSPDGRPLRAGSAARTTSGGPWWRTASA